MRLRDPRIWISVFILLVLGLHALPIISYEGHRQTRWPFMAWAMYAKAHPPGPIQTRDRFLHGITAEGRLVNVTPWEIGMSKPAFRNRYVNAIHRGDTSAALALMTLLNSERKDPIVELRTVETLYTLADTGVLTENLPAHIYRAAGPGAK